MQDLQLQSYSPNRGLINLTHIIYGLHAFAIVIGLVFHSITHTNQSSGAP